jgi:DNA helicase HerA-like ATPase
MQAQPILIAKSFVDVFLYPSMANRHGLIAGATGTGKTVSLKVLAEQFSTMGVPVFLADVKGDLSGICKAGAANPKLDERLKKLGLQDFTYAAYPTVFWDVFGEQGHPVRTTISEMGPLLLSRLLNLNETQTGVLNVVFEVADDQGMLLLDLKDFQSILQYVGDNASEISTKYGRVSVASIGTIQRSLLALSQQAGDKLFGEPALNLDDLIQTEPEGRGVINILVADKLMQTPKMYATLLLWLMSELFEQLPEVGDCDKPKLVFFFDEAHLLFDDAPDALVEKIETVVRLIRSKGVGIYFVTQNPADIPPKILGQLSNRIQHALRAFTPQEQKAVKAAAQTLRPNPKVNVEQAINELAVGEALVSMLDQQGTPAMVERAFILPPHSSFGPADTALRAQIIRQSSVGGYYEKAVDRESAFEMLKKRAEQMVPQNESESVSRPVQNQLPPKQQEPRRVAGRQRESIAEALMKSTARAVGSQMGRAIIRGVMGSIFGGKGRR